MNYIKTIRENQPISAKIRINNEIRAKELRVVDATGNQLGILSLTEALKLASESGLDLVEISPAADPPVVKIIDWGKFQYQKLKEQQKNRKSNKASDLKQMRFGLKIGTNDLEIKLRKIKGFLESGHKVKIMIVFRGREMAHKELGFDLANRLVDSMEEYAVLEQKPILSGRNLSIIVRSK